MRCMEGVQVVFHAATLHKPHVATHRRQEFVDVNVTGTLNHLEASVAVPDLGSPESKFHKYISPRVP
jgi:nucleoside-diphosphate-sugar epimerase